MDFNDNQIGVLMLLFKLLFSASDINKKKIHHLCNSLYKETHVSVLLDRDLPFIAYIKYNSGVSLVITSKISKEQNSI